MPLVMLALSLLLSSLAHAGPINTRDPRVGLNTKAVSELGVSTCEAAVTAIGATPTVLKLDRTITATACTIPATITIECQGGMLDANQTANALAHLGPVSNCDGKQWITDFAVDSVSFAGNKSIPVYYAEWWSATPTQAHINVAIVAANSAGGGFVELLARTYTQTATVTMLSNVTLCGQGDTSVLSLGANTDAITYGAVSNIKICKLKIVGNRGTYTTTSNNGIEHQNGGATDVMMDDVTITNIAGAGILVLAATGAHDTRATVQNSRITDVGAHGIIFQDYVDYGTIIHNFVKDFGMVVSDRPGITLSRSGVDAKASFNTVVGSGSAVGTSVHGISCDTTDGATVSFNKIRNVLGYGVELGFCDHSATVGNVIQSTSRAGIGISGTGSSTNDDVTIIGNVIVAPTAQCIYAFVSSATAKHANLAISNNVCAGNTANPAFQLDNVSHSSAQGNNISSTAAEGIYITASANLSVTGNTLKSIGTHCIRIASASTDIRIQDNTCDEPDTTAGTSFAYYIQFGTRVWLERNHVRDSVPNAEYAIWVESTAANVFLNDNYISGWVTRPIRINTTTASTSRTAIYTDPYTLTVASNGGGTKATATLAYRSAEAKIDCQDPDGCTITLEELYVADRQEFTIQCISTGTCEFADTSGLTELAGAFVAGQYDSLQLKYSTDRWVELDRSDN